MTNGFAKLIRLATSQRFGQTSHIALSFRESSSCTHSDSLSAYQCAEEVSKTTTVMAKVNVLMHSPDGNSWPPVSYLTGDVRGHGRGGLRVGVGVLGDKARVMR